MSCIFAQGDLGIFHIDAQRWPDERPLGLGQRFCTLFVTGPGADIDVLADRATSTIRDWGSRYFCCFGWKCSELHDAIDMNHVMMQVDHLVPDDEHLMTTWHENKPLDDAVFFWRRAAADDHGRFDRHLVVTDQFDINAVVDSAQRQ